MPSTLHKNLRAPFCDILKWKDHHPIKGGCEVSKLRIEMVPNIDVSKVI